MEKVERLLELFDDVAERLYDSELEPDPDRKDWGSQRESVDELAALFEEELLPAIDEARGQLDDEVAGILEKRVSALGLGVFAALHASGQSGRALLLLSHLGERGGRGGVSGLMAAAGRDPASAIELARLRHQRVNGHQVRPALKKLAKKTGEKAIADAALEMFHAPRPIRRAPRLATVNGIGTRLYGARDQNPRDGSVIKTLCLSALFVPVIPLAAYRVLDHGDGSYTFISKNRLSAFARGWRLALAAAVVLTIAYAAVDSYLSSPDRLARKALAAADATREAGQADQAIAEYDALISDYAGRADRQLVAGAATRATRLRIEKVASPLTVATLPQAIAVIRAFRDYPTQAKGDDSGAALTKAVLSWSGDLEGAGAPDAAANLLGEAVAAAPPRSQGQLDERLRAVKTRLANELAPRRPVDALDTLVGLGAWDKAGALIAELKGHPSLLREAAPAIEKWLAHHDGAEIRAALDQARATGNDEGRAAALAGDDPKALAAALASFPSDHELTAALAELDRAAGKPQAAIDRLAALGEPGWLSGAAQQTLAAAHADAGDLETAAHILGELLRYRMPAFRQASKAYRTAAKNLQDRLISRVDSGSAPTEVMAAVRGDDKSAAQNAFEAWLSKEMDSDSHLAQLRDAYQRRSYLVAASLALGNIELRRANQAAATEREALLGEAERAFLAISDDAVGLPSYHLGLGQVYHRLGKTAQGDTELNGLLARGDLELDLAVSGAYRELGKNKRAREIAEKVYNEASSPMREAAASQLSFIVSDLADKETWLERADKSRIEVRAQLARVRGLRAARRGDDTAAAKYYREAAAYYERTAKHDPAAANNAAVAHRGVYEVTGDRRELARAREGLESSYRLEPGDALVVANLAEHTYFEGWLAVLSSELPAKALRLDSDDVDAIASQLAGGKSGIEQAAKNPLLRRSLELTAQETTLSPSSTQGWERAIGWASMRRDAAALEAIEARISRIEIDGSQRAEQQAKWLAGELDDIQRTLLDSAIARHQRMLAAARKARSKRGEAAARYLLGSNLEVRGWRDADVDTLKQAIEHLEAARAGWPELGDTATSARLRLAIVRAGKSSPEVEAMRKSGWREYGPGSMLIEKLIGGAEPIRRAIAADPAVAAAARWLASAGDIEPTVTHWVVGVLAGDRELARRGAESLRRPHAPIAARLAAKLDPKSKAAALFAKLCARPEILDGVAVRVR